MVSMCSEYGILKILNSCSFSNSFSHSGTFGGIFGVSNNL